MDNSLEDKLKEFKKGYLKKLETTVLNLTALLENIQSNIEELYSTVHTISGTSGMYGLKNLSDLSTEFEVYLKEIRNDKSLVDEHELFKKLKKYIEDIKDTILGE